uniref:PDZ domain-containing protein n=1 Tax=Astatotilapia calliptera TaxID=8154 RepID=A0A3P8QCZ4_ASTCA
YKGSARSVQRSTLRAEFGLGFSVRGGSEHGVGIYVSLVEPGSSAEREGLRVGDQIVAANDILFDNVTHIEAVKVGLHANAGVYECDCCGVCTAGTGPCTAVLKTHSLFHYLTPLPKNTAKDISYRF